MAGRQTIADVKKWSVDETAEWAVREGFRDYTATLISREIDGSKLLELQEYQVHYLFRNRDLEKKFLEKLKNLSVNSYERRSATGNGTRSNGMIGRTGGRPQAGYPPVAKTPQANTHDRPALVPQRYQGGNARTNYTPQPQYPTQQAMIPQQMSYNTNDEIDDEWDDDSDDPTLYENNASPFDAQNNQPKPAVKKNYTQCIPRNQRSPGNNVVPERRPVDPPARPPYGAGYNVEHRPHQPPYRQQPAWPQSNFDSPDNSMYLHFDGQGESGRAQPIPQQSYNQYNHQSYPAPSQQELPPPVRERPPHPPPSNHNQFEEQEAYEVPVGSAGNSHHPWRTHPPVVDQMRPRRDRSPAPSPKGPLSRENSAGSSGSLGRGDSTNSKSSQCSSSSGNQGDSLEGPHRIHQDAFPTLKPTSNFPSSGFPPSRPPPPVSKPPPKSLPKMTTPVHEDRDKTTKPKSGFQLPRPHKQTPIVSPDVNKQRKSLPAVNSSGLDLASVLARSPRSPSPGMNAPTPALKFPDAAHQHRKNSAPVTSYVANLENQPWYKNIDRKSAEEKINRNPKEGCFLVRPGSSRECPYSLTVFSQNSTYNLRIRCRDDRNYALGSEKENERAFPTVIDLIEFYMCSQLVLAAGKGSVTLSGPP